MKRLPFVLAIALSLTGCSYLFPPPPSQLKAAGLRSEYVGSEFVGDNGERIRFDRDGIYRTADGRSGHYTISDAGVLSLSGDKNSYLMRPDGFKIRRPDLGGMDIVVVKTQSGYQHTVVGTKEKGLYHKVG